MAVRQFVQGSAGRTEGGSTFYFLLQFGHWKCNRAERQRAWSQHLITGLSHQGSYDMGNYDYRHKRKEKFGSDVSNRWLTDGGCVIRPPINSSYRTIYRHRLTDGTQRRLQSLSLQITSSNYFKYSPICYARNQCSSSSFWLMFLRTLAVKFSFTLYYNKGSVIQ